VNSLAAPSGEVIGERRLFDRSLQQSHDRGGDRERNTNARQAAEALFAPRRPLPEQSIRAASTPAGEPVRKPRVLSISSTAPYPRQERLAAPTGPTGQVTSKIPKSQFARIRAWRRYGMTAQQVADVYGVAVGEIERIVLAS
jgi:hypothetical protein